MENPKHSPTNNFHGIRVVVDSKIGEKMNAIERLKLENNAQLSDENDRVHQENKKLKAEVGYLNQNVQARIIALKKSEEWVQELKEENKEIMDKLREVEKDYKDLSEKHDDATLETPKQIEKLYHTKSKAISVEMRLERNASDISKIVDKLNEVIEKVNTEIIGDEGVIEYIPGKGDAKETIQKIITRNYPQNKE